MMLVLFESNRILLPRYPEMRPFQRKIALLTTALDLVHSLDFLTESQKAKLVSIARKEDSKPMIAKMAFGRAQHLGEEVNAKILADVKELLGSDVSHEEICEAFLQGKYEEITDKTGEQRPIFWEFNRMPIFAIYRVFYRGLEMDPGIFPAVAPRIVDVPPKRPEDLCEYVLRNWTPVDSIVKPDAEMNIDDNAASPKNPRTIKHCGRKQGFRKARCVEMLDDSSAVFEEEKPMANKMGRAEKQGPKAHRPRLQLLMELKMRMEILKEMEGCIPEKRTKKEMMLLLRALPPPADPATGVGNRHAFIMEAKLRLELLKEMKGIIPQKRYANEMRKLFWGLPALAGNSQDMNNEFAGETKAETEVTNDKAEEETNADDTTWEEVEVMEEVNSAVSEIGIA